jgi:hypothetical protein
LTDSERFAYFRIITNTQLYISYEQSNASDTSNILLLNKHHDLCSRFLSPKTRPTTTPDITRTETAAVRTIVIARRLNINKKTNLNN